MGRIEVGLGFLGLVAAGALSASCRPAKSVTASMKAAPVLADIRSAFESGSHERVVEGGRSFREQNCSNPADATQNVPDCAAATVLLAKAAAELGLTCEALLSYEGLSQADRVDLAERFEPMRSKWQAEMNAEPAWVEIQVTFRAESLADLSVRQRDLHMDGAAFSSEHIFRTKKGCHMLWVDLTLEGAGTLAGKSVQVRAPHAIDLQKPTQVGVVLYSRPSRGGIDAAALTFEEKPLNLPPEMRLY
jgi:hypothetical protein